MLSLHQRRQHCVSAIELEDATSCASYSRVKLYTSLVCIHITPRMLLRRIRLDLPLVLYNYGVITLFSWTYIDDSAATGKHTETK